MLIDLLWISIEFHGFFWHCEDILAWLFFGKNSGAAQSSNNFYPLGSWHDSFNAPNDSSKWHLIPWFVGHNSFMIRVKNHSCILSDMSHSKICAQKQNKTESVYHHVQNICSQHIQAPQPMYNCDFEILTQSRFMLANSTSA